MLLSKLAVLLLPVLALAAPAPDAAALDAREEQTLEDLFHIVDGEVLVGPGGYMKEGVFYPGEYNGKRDIHSQETRTFGLKALLLGKLGKGLFGQKGGGSVGQGGVVWGSGQNGQWAWGPGGYVPGGYPCPSGVCCNSC